MKTSEHRVLILGCLLLGVLGRLGSATEPTMRDLFPGKALILPGVEQELGRDVYHRDWDFSKPDKGNFTFFDTGVENLEVTPGKCLRFHTGEKKVILGWGNYKDKQPLAERIHLWPTTNFVELRVKQSADKSTWNLRFWHDGIRIRDPSVATLDGQDWQVLRFPSRRTAYKCSAEVVPDGFELDIECESDNTIEIGSLRITRELHEGYCRKEIDIPAGKIWRATAEVGIGAYLYVNGKHIPLEHAMFHRPRLSQPAASKTYRGTTAGTITVDLKRHLHPGKNCIGLYARQVNDSQLIYLHGKVVMVSGDVVTFATDETWRFSATVPKNWCLPGLDDKDWRTVEVSTWDKPKSVAWHNFTQYLLNTWLIGTGGGYIGPGYPPYDGRIVLENPGEERLFYDTAKPIVVRARVPAGLAERRPSIQWILRRAEEEGKKEIGKGEASKFRRSNDSLVFELQLGTHPRGVYSIETTLCCEGDTLEERPREALVVLGKIPMKEVAGLTYEDGIKATLEDTIDFTDPNDPHEWVETHGGAPYRKGATEAVTEPRIVRKNELVYRETAPLLRHQYASGAPVFSYKFEFKHPGDLYMMILEYPNDAERWIGVTCATVLKNVHNNSKAGGSVWTGGKYPLTHKMQELRWIFRSGPGPHTIDILPVQRDSTAAGARLRIYHIDDLPAMKTNPMGAGNRLIGVYTERTTHHAGFAKTFGPTVQFPSRFGCNPADFQPIPERLTYLRRCLDSCETYTKYLRFTGQNLHAMGCHQYNDGNTPFAPMEALPSSRVPRDLREMLVRVLGHNGIDVIGVISYAGHNCLPEEYPFNDTQVALGTDTALMVSKDGKSPCPRRPGRGYGSGWNALHPRVEDLMLQVAQAVAEKFKNRPNFRGVNWTVYLTGEWMPGFSGMRWSDPLDHTYDDSTIAQLEKDTGVDVPGNAKDPERFQKRYAFLTSDRMKEKWTAWRCRRIHEFFIKARDRVRAERKDLDLFLSLYVDVPHDIAWLASGKPLRQFLREWGYDLSLYQNDDDLWCGRWMHVILHGAPARRTPDYAAGWEQSVGPEFIELYKPCRRRAVILMHQWFEIYYRFPGVLYEPGKHMGWCRFVDEDKPTWPVPGNRGRHLFQSAGDNAREAFIQAMVGTDPQILMYGFMDVNMMVGQEQELREFAKVFQALPGEKFEPVLGTGLQTNFAIRELKKGDDYYFYIANPGYWPIQGTVTVSSLNAVTDIAYNQPVKIQRKPDGSVFTVSLRPYEIMAYRVKDPKAKVVSWKTDPVDEKHLAHMREIMKKAAAVLADPEQKERLSDDDRAFVQATIDDAKADLADGKVARAWSRLTYCRFWTLIRTEDLPQRRK